ncbi:unnamed protein product [Medioppia subpectinata]|uniref:Caseinolytic peptidase B protein homolog n=1 Tax=Medioppia subpectinata TaxID=1979941 RepID=A0A7R9KYK9_9ACAR|nr:unnamed protein product [Medioppia subpectinata]CAG2111953.1 unnamed protein product [Medioppia subpectinata]
MSLVRIKHVTREAVSSALTSTGRYGRRPMATTTGTTSTRGQHRYHRWRRSTTALSSLASLYCCCHYFAAKRWPPEGADGHRRWLSSAVAVRAVHCLLMRDDSYNPNGGGNGDRNRYKRQNTPQEEQLFAAIRSGDTPAVRQLLADQKVDPNCRHTLGWNPLLLAAVNGRTDVCQLLLESGADIDATDEYSSAQKMSYYYGLNYLTVASRREQDFSDLLSTRVSFRGTTALHYAVLSASGATVDLLVSRGANPSVENEIGHKPYDYCKVDDREIQKTLIEAEKRYSAAEAKRRLDERLKFPLEERIKTVIVGQQSAITTVAAAIRRKENGWYDDEHPLVMLFLGSSGIGKTELAKQVAAYLQPNGKGFIRMDMTEYQEKHEVSKFIGAPPGYVGHDDGGQLTKALRDSPNAVVLFDEVEKAHNDVLTILLQLFDEGRLTDGKGQTIECKDAIFIMTSNLASDEIGAYGQSLRKAAEEAAKTRLEKASSLETVEDDTEEMVQVSKQFKEEVIRPILKQHFKRDEFLGRINEMVYFLQFSRHELNQLVIRELQYWADRALKRHQMSLTWDKRVVGLIADEYNVYYGARSIKHEVERRIINKIAFAHESQLISSGAGVHITVEEGWDQEEEVPNEASDEPDVNANVDGLEGIDGQTEGQVEGSDAENKPPAVERKVKTLDQKIKIQLKDKSSQKEEVFVDIPVNEKMKSRLKVKKL